MRINGRPYTHRNLKAAAGYVMQEDVLHAHLTVSETVGYCAELRMKSTSTPEERAKRVDEVIALMGLSHAKNTIVGDSMNKGISGGERKRLSCAKELLLRPKLLFLDEPTSGLDSVTALSVVTTLKRIASSKRATVICSLHQPQTKIYHMFDNLVLVKRGMVMYR